MFHVNPETGKTGFCSAKKGRCPFGGIDQHYTSEVAARAAFERTQESLTSISKVIHHEMKLSKDVEQILGQFYDSGLTPYIVGGSVRDSYISGAAPKDIDIEVFGLEDMDDLEAALKSYGYKVDPVGRSFGVFKLRTRNGEDLDISLPRKDSKVSEGHRGFEVQVDTGLTLEEAAGRRDFTINSLYYSAREKRIRDPYGGVADWSKRQLRHINESFGDDPLRVIRGVQFAARFNMALAPETAELSRTMSGEFANLSMGRVQTEFEKLFTKGSVQAGFAALRETEWDFELNLDRVSEKTAAAADASIARAKTLNEDAPVYAVARILDEVEGKKTRAQVSDYLLTGVKRQEKAQRLNSFPGPVALDERSLRAWARKAEKEAKLSPKDIYIHEGNERVKDALEIHGIFERADPDLVTGARVLEHTERKPGPWLGALLREANAAQDAGVFTEEERARSWIQAKLPTLGE